MYFGLLLLGEKRYFVKCLAVLTKIQQNHCDSAPLKMTKETVEVTAEDHLLFTAVYSKRCFKRLVMKTSEINIFVMSSCHLE